MSWIKEKEGDENVKGIIIAAVFDKKLECALQVVPNCLRLSHFSRTQSKSDAVHAS